MIGKINNFPLLGKFYTLPFLMNLNNFCIENGCGIDLESIETFEQDSILENILLLLNNICGLESKDNSENIFAEFKNIKVKIKFTFNSW